MSTNLSKLIDKLFLKSNYECEEDQYEIEIEYNDLYSSSDNIYRYNVTLHYNDKSISTVAVSSRNIKYMSEESLRDQQKYVLRSALECLLDTISFSKLSFYDWCKELGKKYNIEDHSNNAELLQEYIQEQNVRANMIDMFGLVELERMLSAHNS